MNTETMHEISHIVLDKSVAKALFMALMDHGFEQGLFPQITPKGRPVGVIHPSEFSLFDCFHYHLFEHDNGYQSFYFSPYVDYDEEEEDFPDFDEIEDC